MDTCLIHPEEPAVDFLTVPCAPNGKVGICVACKARYENPETKRAFITESFQAYQQSHHSAKGQRIAQYKHQN